MQNAKISAKEYMEHEEIKREINQRERKRKREKSMAQGGSRNHLPK